MGTDVLVVDGFVSSEIVGGKLPEIYSNLSRNFRKFVQDFLNFMHLVIIMCFQV